MNDVRLGKTIVGLGAKYSERVAGVYRRKKKKKRDSFQKTVDRK